MNPSEQFSSGPDVRPQRHALSRNTVALIADLLPLCDFVGVLLAAYLGALVYTNGAGAGAPAFGFWADGGGAALVAAVLAPFILCDRAFVSFAGNGQTASLIRCYAVRFAMFAGAVVTIGWASRFLETLPRAWLVLWFVGTLLVTSIMRVLLVGGLRRMERKGVLSETIAVVGAGPVADRLIRHLLRTRRDCVEIVGVFDDRAGRRDGTVGAAQPPTGSIADLIELGKSRPLDWILLTPPGSADARVRSIVHRLKALAVPVGLCPQDADLAVARKIHYLGNGLPVTNLADRPAANWASTLTAVETVVPGWMITLFGLPLVALRFLLATARRSAPWRTPSRRISLTCPLDPYDLDGFAAVAARFGQKRFGYVVTPNADHLIRLHREPAFRPLYAGADYVLLDSRFISHLLRFTRNVRLPVCPGSDLTEKLFRDVIAPDDRLVLIGGTDAQAACLAGRYGLKQLAHFNPPMGLLDDPAAMEACLQFAEAHSPFRYCLLAVGSPQQEVLAQRLKARGRARGMALCVGGSIAFLTGGERRAPVWVRRCGFEWLFRLLQAPGRMAQRYLVRGPRLFWLLRRTQFVSRAPVIQLAREAAAVARPQRPSMARSRRRVAAPARAIRRASAQNESSPAP